MDRNNFNIIYLHKGGVDQLSKMREDLCTLKQISEHFGVTRERVRQWMVEIFGKEYDPRRARKAVRKLL